MRTIVYIEKCVVPFCLCFEKVVAFDCLDKMETVETEETSVDKKIEKEVFHWILSYSP